MAPSVTGRKTPEQESSVRETMHSIVDYPFPHSSDIKSLVGNSVYTTAQTIVQQTAYAVSKTIFSYSTEGFDLDNALEIWHSTGQKNGRGDIPRLAQLESRVGAGSVLLGYVFNEPESQPSSVLASTGTLKLMQSVLAQYALRPSIKAPLAFNVAAVDYFDGKLVTDYYSAIQVAKSLGLGLISSSGVEDVQIVTLLATVLSSLIPTIHVYDGIQAIRESAKSSGLHGVEELSKVYEDMTADISEVAAGKLSLQQKLLSLIDRVNGKLGSNFQPFEYSGSAQAKTVVISFGSVEGALVESVFAGSSADVGAINVRLYSPFLESKFFEVLPSTVEKIVVLGQTTDSNIHSALFADVSTAVYMRSGNIEVVEYAYSDVSELSASKLSEAVPVDALHNVSKSVTFYSTEKSAAIHAASTLAHTLSFDNSQSINYATVYDNELAGGIVHTRLRIAPKNAALSVRAANGVDTVLIDSEHILKSVDIISEVNEGATVILGFKLEESTANPAFKSSVAAKHVRLYELDLSAIGDDHETQGRTQAMVLQIAFWSLVYPELSVNQITSKIVLSNGNDTELVAATIVRLAEKVLESVLLPINTEGWATEEQQQEAALALLEHRGFQGNEFEDEASTGAAEQPWIEAAKRVVFGEAYNTENELRPDLPIKNYIAKVQVNQRVTPDDYDRHIFHLELDVSNTGLTYAIGEALGVHAPNNSQQVDEFISWYKLDPNAIVSIPSSAEGQVEAKTVVQALRHNLDIFGKPPKKFYEALAEFAQDEEEKKTLGKIAAPTGAVELKRRSDEEFATYADVLEEFSSARPTFSQLVEIVAPLKRREYSIASSQKVHENAVHLLIVVVDWVDSRGRKRYGQCSKYLADLDIGAEVVVSVKPSVMKLPVDPAKPVIMAGLGTGLAPFKAFLEEKTWQKQQGQDIGDVYLFLGSRHQRQEYLYGELFEAYRDAGILTYIGAAFSRDQPQKIYIQDRIREAKERLSDAFVTKHGSFYLCGPTWPVPDVSQALFDVVSEEAAIRGETLEFVRVIESLKEEERYILEVY